MTFLLSNEICLLLFATMNYGSILLLYYFENIGLLRKMMLASVVLSMAFSGNLIVAFGLTLNVGIVLLVNYYLLLFMLMTVYTQDECILLLRETCYILFFMWIMSIPLILFQYNTTLFSLKNLTFEILVNRINYMAAIVTVFYLGTLAYVQSFSFVKSRKVTTISGFIFEYFGRMQVIMTAQSLVFYSIISIINSSHINDITINVSSLSDVIFDGMLIRFGLLLFISGFVYYILLRESEKQKDQ